jgi:hypothetical protein
MIHVTYDPIEGVLVVIAGTFLVDMYIWGDDFLGLPQDKIPYMDVVTPARGK